MNEQDTDIHELSGKTPEFRTQLAKQLIDLVPEAIADGKVDVAKLKELLDEDAGDTNERFGLFWPGKKRAMRAAQDPTTATLKPAKSESKDWDTTENIFIEGDNLEVLKVLQKQYHNSIKMIYIDPPYNTGKDFVYPDNFKEGLQNYLEFSKQVDAGGKKISTNAETAGRYHSNWLNMMYPRLKLARNLLADDGVIFISIDDAEQSNLKRVCDEIFGESNFIATVIHQRAKGGGMAKNFVNSHDYIHVYARNASLIDLKQRKIVQQKVVMKDGEEYLINDDLYRRNFGGKIDKSAPHRCFFYEEIEEAKGVAEKQFIDSEIAAGRYFLKEYRNGMHLVARYEKVSDSYSKVYGIIKVLSEEGKKETDELVGENIFSYPKPTQLIKFLVEIATQGGGGKNGLILDFFSGSGTTAHAVMQLNAEDGGSRKHIQVQLPEPTDEKSEAYKAGYRKISDIARERINRAGEKIKTDYADKLAERDTPLDIGYRTYKLSDTNFTKWKSEATNDLGELQMRLDAMRSSSDDNASEEDLLVEVMLKLGLPLTSRTIEREVSGLTVHQVVASADLTDSDTQPVFYLNEHTKPTLEQLRAVVTELTPSRFVILDDAFQGDSQLKTNLVQTSKSYDVELWTV
jgi:adenine-specific DNA-methyltransferase